MTKSKIFLFFCLSFIAGVFVQSMWSLQLLIWLGILILGVILAATFWARAPKIIVVGFCLIILAGGAGRYSQTANSPNSIKQFNDKGVFVLRGKIIEEPDARSDNIKYKMEVIGVAQNLPFDNAQGINFARATGYILLVAQKYPAYNYGDAVEIKGKLKTPVTLDDFDYAKYLAKDDIYSIAYYPEISLLESGRGNWLKEKLFFVKEKFKESVGQILVEPQASFLAGLLLGEKRGLPEDLMVDFGRTGTTHIIALSGYNITIIAVALMGLFNFFMLRRRISFWVAVAVIISFVVMTGAAASVVRAAVMGILILLARQSGRLYNIRNALALAGAAMIYINPKVLVFDLGFQLSFAATLGLVYLSPILTRWIACQKEDQPATKGRLGLKEILIATLSAQIAVLPLLVINFGQLSLIAPLANVLILLFIPATMFWGFLAGVAGIFWLGLGKILGWVAWLLLTYEIKIIEWLAKIPLAAVEFNWSWWGGGIYYAVLIYSVWRFTGRQRMELSGVGK